MILEAIFHNPVSNYAFPVSSQALKVRLRAAKGDLDRVRLVIGNKYLWNTRKELPMELGGCDKLFDYFECVYQVDDPRVAYYFILEKGDEVWLYGDNGLVKPEDVDVNADESAGFVNFHFPFINPIDVHQTPEWVHSAVFYQIFPERFCNGNPELSPEGVVPWGTTPDRNLFMGGDLPGITQKLPYLEELGVNALYLTPIFEARSNHKYDTVDYTRLDPHFGDETDLVELIQQAHKRGIKIILDGVFNHCGGGFRQFQDVVEHGETSPFKDWFYIREFPVSFDPLNFDAFGTTPYVPRPESFKSIPLQVLKKACMPKLNTENPQVKEYLLGAVAKWTRMGIDGWRLDVAAEVDSYFWREFRETVRNINPQAVIIGEYWRNAQPWLQGDQFDGVMNYGVQRAAELYFAKDGATPQGFQEILTENLMRYSDQANHSMLNLLDSHDTARFLTLCHGNTGKLKNAASFLFTFVGMPCTCYGTEIGMTGENDPDCRKGFDWDTSHWDEDLRSHYQKLMALRKSKKALQYGTVKFCSQKDVFVMERCWEEEKLVVAINNTQQTQRCALPGNRWKDLLGEGIFQQSHGSLEVEIPPLTGMILEAEDE